MSEGEREEEGVGSWQEWSPLTPLLDQLPHHFQRGLSTSDLHLTCLAALPQHLLLGTNVGLVYLAHLPSLNLMRLKCENPVEGISCVAGVRTVEDMVAVGGNSGTITIFQLPRCDVGARAAGGGANNNNSSGSGVGIGSLSIGVGGIIGGVAGGGGVAGQTHTSPHTHPPVKRFTVTTTHNARITALTWSLNGLLLFSGDEGGAVGVVEVDPTRCECTARPLLTEPSPIAQLSYLHQRLAVSTHERVIVYLPSDGTHVQVGVKPRKHPGRFGCVWSPSTPKKSGLLFTSRPGLRLWAAESSGEVLNTHIVRDLPVVAESVLLNPSAEAGRDSEHFSFGLLHSLGPHSLVSHTRRWLIAFHTLQRRIITYSGRFRDVTGVAVCDSQIFVLEGHRTVVCLSPHPPEYIGSTRVPRPPTLGLWELGQLGSKIVTQGTGLMDHIARVGSSVAAKVSEHTAPPVLTGQKGGLGRGGRGAWEKGQEGKEERGLMESVASAVPSLHRPPSVSSSLSSSSPSSSSSSSSPPQMMAPPSPHLTAPPNTTTAYSSSYDDMFGNVVVEVVEEAGAAGGGGGGGGGDSLESCGPLVMRERIKRKKARKNASTHSQDTQSDASSSPTTSTPPVLPPPPPTQDINTNIQEKEILLADILDMECLKLDHPPPPQETNSPSTPSSHPPDSLPWGSEIGDSSETQCSTPSTIKETSPAPNSTSGDDFYSRFYQGQLSCSSMESSDGVERHTRETEEEEEEEDLERLPSNFSEDRSSCLSYGPPSGSSLPSHSQPHLLLHVPPPLTPQLNHRQVILNDSSEIADITLSYPHEEEEEDEEEEEEEEVLCGGWVRRSLPGSAVSLAVSRTCRAFVNTSGHLYLAGGQGNDPWRKVTLTRAAQQVSLAPGGGVGWVVVDGGEGYAFVPPPMPAAPHNPTKMAAVARDVRQASVGEERTWYLDAQMQVCVCPSISEEITFTYVSAGPGGGTHELVQVVTMGQVVWALTRSGQLLFRIGINSTNNNNNSTNNNNNNSNTGQEWGVMAGPDSPQQGPPNTPIVGVALGAGGLAWVVDGRGRLFFREGVCEAYPQGDDLRWWQVETSVYMVGEELEVGRVLLAASEVGVWLAEGGAQTCCMHTPPITGHWWDVFSEEVWSVVCAEGLYTTQGALCCLSPLGQLFLINPNTSSTVPLDPPPPPGSPSPGSSDGSVVVSVSQRPEVLWVVTGDGRVFIRAGLSASSLIGTHWDELDLTQIGDIQLCHISCGTEVVWGVDTKGGVYMRQGPLTPCHTQSLPPAWIQVEPSPGTNVEFTKVFVGARLHLVWALDSCLRVYVRQAIYPELPVGLSWVLVPGLAATHLSISEDQVVALTPRGEVFRRTGVSANNFIGDAWERIPGRLAGVSVTTDNTLWGLNACGYLCKHMWREVDCANTTSTSTSSSPHHSTTTAERLHTISLSSETEDWEVL